MKVSQDSRRSQSANEEQNQNRFGIGYVEFVITDSNPQSIDCVLSRINKEFNVSIGITAKKDIARNTLSVINIEDVDENPYKNKHEGNIILRKSLLYYVVIRVNKIDQHSFQNRVNKLYTKISNGLANLRCYSFMLITKKNISESRHVIEQLPSLVETYTITTSARNRPLIVDLMEKLFLGRGFMKIIEDRLTEMENSITLISIEESLDLKKLFLERNTLHYLEDRLNDTTNLLKLLEYFNTYFKGSHILPCLDIMIKKSFQLTDDLRFKYEIVKDRLNNILRFLDNVIQMKHLESSHKLEKRVERLEILAIILSLASLILTFSSLF